MTETASRPRQRTTRGRNNDERVLNAAVEVVAEKGVDNFSLREVAASADLTYGALYARYGNARELLADVWQRRYVGELRRLIDQAVAVTKAPEPAVPVFDVTATTIGMLECLTTAHRIGELGDLVPSDLNNILSSNGLIEPVPNPFRLGVLSLMIGDAMHFDSVARNTEPIALPRSEVVDTDPITPKVSGGLKVNIPGQPQRQMLMQSAFEIIIRSGFHGVTLRRLSRVSGYSHNVVYSLYGGIEGLINDVIAPGRLTPPPETLLGRYSDPVQSALQLGSWMMPEARDLRRLLLEFRVGTMRNERHTRETDAVDEAMYSSVAALVGEPGTVPYEKVLMNGGNSRNLLFGLCMLSEAGVPMSGIDWRPFTRRLIRTP